MLELETQSASRKLPPEVWARGVRYAVEKGYPFRYWEISNEPYTRRAAAQHLQLMRNGDKEVREIPLPQSNPAGYLKAFLNDVAGASGDDELSTPLVLRATYQTLRVQHAADQGECNVDLESIP